MFEIIQMKQLSRTMPELQSEVFQKNTRRCRFDLLLLIKLIFFERKK